MDFILKVKEKIKLLLTNRYLFFYKKKLRKKLKNDNFTILASNCAAGVFYNRLGKEFLSPTINMWFRQEEFLTFCCNLKHYVNSELVFIKDQEYDYPVALLDDIHLYFNHSKTENEARENWNRRKTRINYDNLYILMYDRGTLTKDEYLKLNDVNCKNKVVITPNEELDLEFSYYIKPNLDKLLGDSYLDRDWKTITTLEKKFDFVSWLNS